uniref:RNA-binding protein Raly isoform X2 n=1 Tax=Oncorhynchus gorbuscha TaxID=8017 RepID=UPI001EAF30EB|nr:RNA-binding protein Raly isoform X2 [Oncorhynchus gorbuscha]
MANASEIKRSTFEEAPRSFKSAVWEYFGFSVQYDDEDILRFLTKMSLKVQTSNVTNKNDPKSINSRVFIGNLNTAVVKKMDVETIFSKYGRMLGCSVHKGYAFVQYASERHASGAVIGENGRMLAGQTLDINMAGEPKPNRPKGLKRSATALYSGYDFDYHYYRNELYGRLFEYRGRVSPVPRVVPVKRPRMAMPLVRRVKSLPVKLLARASVLPGNTIKQKSVNSNELQDIKSELTQIKFNIDALLGRLERITEDKHIAAELRTSEDNKSEAFQDESFSDTEELVEEPHNSDVEEDVTQNECEDDDMENNHLSEMDSNLQ